MKKEKDTPTDKICIWGIERFFDPKQCYKYFCKNFGEHSNVTHLLKQKSKPFFIVKFNAPLIVDEFNSQFAKNKKIKAKPMQENMQISEEEFVTVEDCTKAAEKREVNAT